MADADLDGLLSNLKPNPATAPQSTNGVQWNYPPAATDNPLDHMLAKLTPPEKSFGQKAMNVVSDLGSMLPQTQNYPAELSSEITQGTQQAMEGLQGARNAGVSWQGAKQLGSAAMGELGALTAPLNAGIQTAVVDPITKLFGNQEIGDRAGMVAGLAVPGARVIPKAGAEAALAPRVAAAAERVEPTMQPLTVHPRPEEPAAPPPAPANDIKAPTNAAADSGLDDILKSVTETLVPKTAPENKAAIDQLSDDDFDKFMKGEATLDELMPKKGTAPGKPTLAVSNDKKLLDFQKELIAKNAEPDALPMDHASRMQRAASMGFDTSKTFYHGTDKNFLEFDTGKGKSGEKAVFVTDNPKIAEYYGQQQGKQIVPLHGKMQNPLEVDAGGKNYSNSQMVQWLKQAKANGNDVLVVHNVYDMGGKQTQYAFLKPENLRAKYGAAFDESKAHSANMLSAANAKLSEILQGNIDDQSKLPLAKSPGFLQGIKDSAKAVQSIFSPETVDANARRAAANIRAGLGGAAGSSARATASVEQFRKLVNSMDQDQRLAIFDYMQNRSKLGEPVDAVKPFLNAMRNEYQKRRVELEQLHSTAKMAFQEDYLPQMWKDPEAAARLFGSKEGGSGFTKQKKIENYAEGIRAGLVPITTDPIELMARYVENADRFIATNKVFDEARANGDILFRKVGEQPDGYVELNGALARKTPPGQNAYAPEGWARVYNNFVSKRNFGSSDPQIASLFSTAQRGLNSVSAFKFSLGAYHGSLTALGSVATKLAEAFKQTGRGDIGGALKSAAAAPAAPIATALKGRKLSKAYTADMTSLSPEMQRIVELAEKANFRMNLRKGVADEYRFSGTGSFYDALRKGTLKAELASDLKGIRGVPSATSAAFKQIGRTLDTLSQPILGMYVPAIRKGAFYDGMSKWLEGHPDAAPAEQEAYARHLSDIIDDRFGEMNQDNIFWNNTLKQMGTLMATSYSYEMGTARSIGGAARDAVKLPFGGPQYYDKLAYAAALPITFGMVGAITQYLYTGNGPESARDLLAPRDGGTDASTGQPSRILIPAPDIKDLEGLLQDPVGEVTNKLSPGVQTAKEMLTNKDWRDLPIAKSTDTLPQALKAYLKFIADAYSPITAEGSTVRKGSRVGPTERFLGVRSAPERMINPQGSQAKMRKYAQGQDKRKDRADARDAQRYQ